MQLPHHNAVLLACYPTAATYIKLLKRSTSKSFQKVKSYLSDVLVSTYNRTTSYRRRPAGQSEQINTDVFLYAILMYQQLLFIE